MEYSITRTNKKLSNFQQQLTQLSNQFNMLKNYLDFKFGSDFVNFCDPQAAEQNYFVQDDDNMIKMEPIDVKDVDVDVDLDNVNDDDFEPVHHVLDEINNINLDGFERLLVGIQSSDCKNGDDLTHFTADDYDNEDDKGNVQKTTSNDDPRRRKRQNAAIIDDSASDDDDDDDDDEDFLPKKTSSLGKKKKKPVQVVQDQEWGIHNGSNSSLNSSPQPLSKYKMTRAVLAPGDPHRHTQHGIEYKLSSHGNEVLTHSSYTYRFTSISSNKDRIYWICAFKGKLGCTGKLSQCSLTGKPYLDKAIHCHLPTDERKKQRSKTKTTRAINSTINALKLPKNK